MEQYGHAVGHQFDCYAFHLITYFWQVTTSDCTDKDDGTNEYEVLTAPPKNFRYYPIYYYQSITNTVIVIQFIMIFNI